MPRPELPGSAAAVDRAARLAGPDAVIQAVYALAGGTHARTWLIRTANPEREVVLREFPAGDEAAARETRVLGALDGLGGLAPLVLASDGSPAALHGPAAARVAGHWASLAHAPRVLTHYDFWSGNTLWADGTLTGVVDWSGAVLGPPGFDVGWCRLDLYLLYGEAIASQFLDSYQAASGPPCPTRGGATCGPPPGRTAMSRPGSRTTATWGAAT